MTALGSVLCVRLLSGRRFGCRRRGAGKLTDSREYFSPVSERDADVLQGFSIVSRNSERCFEAELYRLKARALLMRGASDAEAESLLDQALRIARSQQARSLELRAATDLARLWMRQGKHAEALDGLASIHSRFTEGFDTRDVKEAKAVLAELQ